MELTTLQIVGLGTLGLILLILACVFDYAFKICWCATLPCRGAYYCCGKMKYNEGVCGCDGHCVI